MKRRRLQPLVWPLALLVVGALTAGLAEATTWSVSTITLFGTLKIVSDLTLAIAAVWFIVAGVRTLLVRPAKRRV